MEVTVLIQATDEAFKIIEEARNRALDVLNTSVKFTAEAKLLEERKIQAIFKGAERTKSEVLSFLATFALLFFPFWMPLSGFFDVFHLSIGVGCCALVAYISHDLLFVNVRVGDMRTIVKRFFTYIPWLIYQIILSNIHVVKIVLSPKMPIDPKIIKFKTKLDSDISLVTFANSITLTPGTITIDIKDGEYYVHAIDEDVAYDLLYGGEMEDRVAHVFMEAEHVYVQDVLDVARIYGALR
ncbi:MAG: Na+/H+ antiporter subunit E [Thermodesulfobacteriota bacterium]|nr:Na+/H+ antiporter subunit E [Thermodesulfobacteriota bacterium]